MFKFQSQLLRPKKSWGTADDVRTQGREDRYRQRQQGIDPNAPHRSDAYKEQMNTQKARQFWGEFQGYILKVLNQYKIKNVAFTDWLDRYGLEELRKSQDQVVREHTNKILKMIKDQGEAGMAEMDQGVSPDDKSIAPSSIFKKMFGSNVQGWLMGGEARRASLKQAKFDFELGPYTNQDSGRDNDAEDDMDPDSMLRDTTESHDSR
jgi:hypothetical protein